MRHVLLALVTLLLMSGVVSAQSAAKSALERRLPTVKFSDIALMDALDFFRDTTDANFVVDWKTMEQVGVSKETSVSLNLRYVPTRTALRATLEAAAPGLLTYYVDENVIHVTTLAKADEKMIVRIYPVQDLLVEIPDFEGPSLSLTDNQSGQSGRGNRNGGRNGGGLGGGGSIFDNNNSRDRDEEKSKTRAERAQDLIDLIKETVRPEVWDTNGGKAKIRYFNGTLIVTAPRSVQEAIGGPID